MRDTARVGLGMAAARVPPPILSISGLCLALTLAGCGDDGPADPGTGAVEVTTVSTGQGLDTDGYIVAVVGAGSLAIGTNATATLAEVPAGDLEIRLTEVRGNCTVQEPHPRLIRVVAGETFRTHFDVVCAHTPLLGRIVFSSNRHGNFDLYSMNVDGSGAVQLTDTPEEEREVLPAVSPDGSRILFVNRIGPEDDFYTEYLYVMNADGTDPVRLPPLNGGGIGAPVWSPDGSQIAFSGWIGDPGYDIWVMDADGTGLRNLTNTPDVGESSPSWSPDGRRILFFSEGATPGLHVINSDGTGRAELAGNGAYWAVWSPDGARIAFLTIVDERSRLYTMSADGSDPMPLRGDDGGHDLIASWSPGADRLAFIHDVDGDVEVYVINADGTGAVNISDNDTFEYLGPQAWGP
jgi:Tol biopolymer transport system component